MSRFMVKLLLVVLVVAGMMVFLANLDTEQEPKLIEKPVSVDQTDQ